MQIQRLTVLDAARLAREIKKLKEARIIGVFRNQCRTEAYIETENPALVLKYRIDNRISYASIIKSVPSDTLKVIPGLNGNTLAGAFQLNFDRIIEISLEKEDRLGRITNARLIFELIPNTGNMLFTDEAGSVKGALRKSKTRKYVFPAPLKKPNVLNLEDDRIDEKKLDGETLIDRIYGLNRRDISNLSDRLRIEPGSVSDRLVDYAARAIRPGPAWMVLEEGIPVGYSLVEPSLASGELSVKYDSALLLYEAYYGEALRLESETKRIESMQALLEKEIHRQSRKIEDLRKAAAENEESLNYRKFGELLLANLGKIRKGSRKVNLPDVEIPSSEMVEIKLDPARSPAANAEAYFRKYKKAVAREKILRQRLKTARERMELLRSIGKDHGDDPDLLEQELKKLRIIGTISGPSSRKKKEKRKPYRKYLASCGWEILVGRTNADNDELTFKIAAKHDIWFHAWQAAGSHTILRLPARNSMPDRKTLQEAASLAAYFSKARRSSKVPVIYTQVKYVRKPRKFPPGKVVVEREKQLMVKPADPDDFLPTDDR